MPTSRLIPFQGEALFPHTYNCDHTEMQDLVIIDRMEEKMDIFKITVPLETNIKNANAQKMNKYEHFITDITTRDVSVHPFEIGSNGLKTLLFRVFVEWGGKRFLG